MANYTKEDIKRLVTRYVTLKQRQNKIETEMKCIRDALIEYVSEQPDMKTVVGKRTLSVTQCNKKTISFTELCKKHPKIAAAFAKVSSYPQLNVR